MTKQQSKELYKEFNKNAKLFVRELMKVYPEAKILKLMHMAYKVCKTFNRKLPQKYFNEAVAIPYGIFINNRDDTFIYNKEFSSEAILPGVDAFIREEWPKLDEHNRKKIWDYMQVLCVLNKRCVDYQQATGEVVNENEKDPDNSDTDD